MQTRLMASNPQLADLDAQLRPDGDADVDKTLINDIQCPSCLQCGGVLMPDVVFFGGVVPRHRQQTALEGLEKADALMVVGSSLVVFSGYRFCKVAKELGKPILIINRGKTRADDIATLKIDQDCGEVLAFLSASMD